MSADAPEGAVTLLCSTTFDVAGHTVERQVGLCWGLVVRSVGIAKGITGSFRSLKAGEVPEFTGVVEEARRHAVERLFEHARSLGANAVVGVRFDSSDLGQGLAEVVAYGTAVVVSQG